MCCVFVNYLVKQFAIFLGVVVILLLNVMKVLIVGGGALLDRPCMVFQRMCVLPVIGQNNQFHRYQSVSQVTSVSDSIISISLYQSVSVSISLYQSVSVCIINISQYHQYQSLSSVSDIIISIILYHQSLAYVSVSIVVVVYPHLHACLEVSFHTLK